MAPSHTRVRVAPNLYQRGDGRFVAGFTVNGSWRMKTLAARTKREARFELAALQAALREPAPESAGSSEPAPSVSEVAAEFLQRFQAQVSSGERSPRTLDHYRWVLDSYLLPAWGERELAGIGPDDVVVLTQALRVRGRTPAVLRALEGTASRLFSFAVRRGYIESNPVAKLERGERAKVKNDDRRVLTHDEISRLLLSADGLFTQTLLAVLLYTGIRQGELLALRWGDLDFEQGLLRLRRQLQRPRGGNPALLAPLKMDSEREVVLVPQLAWLLREHRRGSPHSRDDDFVFARGNGSPLHFSRMNRLLKKAAAAAGIDGLSAHVFRRTFASHLIIDQGLDGVRVQRQLGHSRTSVTYDRYSFLFEQARHADALRESIAGSTYGSLLTSVRSGSLTRPGFVSDLADIAGRDGRRAVDLPAPVAQTRSNA